MTCQRWQKIRHLFINKTETTLQASHSIEALMLKTQNQTAEFLNKSAQKVFMIQKKSLGYTTHSKMKCKKISFFIRIKHAVRQLQRRFYDIVSREDNIGNSFIELKEARGNLMDGYFSVLAKGNHGMRKFQIALYYLQHPPFVKLLEAAAQEFGFDQPGVLVIPCEANELERILTRQSLRPKLNNSVCSSY